MNQIISLLILSLFIFSGYPIQGQNQQEIQEFEKMVQKYRSENNNLELSKYLTKLGNAYWGASKHEKAIEAFDQAIKINETLGNNNAIRSLNSTVGLICLDQQNYDKAISYIKKSLALNRKMNKKADLASDIINIGTALQGLGKYDESNKQVDEALQLGEELSDLQLMKSCYTMMAENYEKLGNTQKSYEYFEKATTLTKHLKNQEVKSLTSQKQQAEASIIAKEQQLKQTVDTLNEVMEINKERQLQIQLLNKEKELKDMALKEEQAKMRELKEKERNRRLVILFLSGGLILVLGFFVMIIWQFREKQKAYKLLEVKNDEIEKQKIQIEKQHEIVTHQNQKITDSIQYAKRIQTAVLPPRNAIEPYLPDHFILFKPKDIVSGDFFWFAQKENSIIIAAADCTGHGVPGAFMSMMGIAYLNEVVNKIIVNKHISSLQANEILNELRDYVIKSLHQTGKMDEMKDGMDIALIVVDFEHKTVQFSGAHNSLYLIRNQQLTVYEGDNMPIGIHKIADLRFVNNEIPLEKGDCLYIFSDGYYDQFGGTHGMKFMSKKFKELLLKIHEQPMIEQKNILDNTIEAWKGHRDQIDDMLVIGLRFTGTKLTKPLDENAPWASKMILVAEDTDMNFFLIAEALKPSKVQLHRVSNGVEALEFIKKNKVDLVLMDLNMPLMDGYEATRQIKVLKPHLPIIAQTALGLSDEIKKCKEYGFDDFISKPIILRTFLQKIERSLFK